MTQPKDTTTRSTLNRLSGLQAGQEQLQADVERMRSDVKAVLIICLYVAALAMLTFAVAKWGAR